VKTVSRIRTFACVTLAIVLLLAFHADRGSAQNSQWGPPVRSVLVGLASGKSEEFIAAMREFAAAHGLLIDVMRDSNGGDYQDTLSLTGNDYMLTADNFVREHDAFSVFISPQASHPPDAAVVERLIADLRETARRIPGSEIIERAVSRPRSPLRQFVVTGGPQLDDAIFEGLRAAGASFGFRVVPLPPQYRQMVMYSNDGYVSVQPGNPREDLGVKFWPNAGVVDPSMEPFFVSVGERLKKIRGVQVFETDDTADDLVQGYTVQLRPGTRQLFFDRMDQFAAALGFRFLIQDLGSDNYTLRLERPDGRFSGGNYNSVSLDRFAMSLLPTIHHPISAAAAERLLADFVTAVRSVPGASIVECDTYLRTGRMADRNGPGGSPLPADTSSGPRPVC
jgi:hypothetical protein